MTLSDDEEEIEAEPAIYEMVSGHGDGKETEEMAECMQQKVVNMDSGWHINSAFKDGNIALFALLMY